MIGRLASVAEPEPEQGSSDSPHHALSLWGCAWAGARGGRVGEVRRWFFNRTEMPGKKRGTPSHVCKSASALKFETPFHSIEETLSFLTCSWSDQMSKSWGRKGARTWHAAGCDCGESQSCFLGGFRPGCVPAALFSLTSAVCSGVWTAAASHEGDPFRGTLHCGEGSGAQFTCSFFST